jgi:phage gp46-like protein
MSNSALQFTRNDAIGSGDTVNSRSLKQGDWLQAAVFTSLFTDARATEEQTPDWATDQGGYWGDMFYDESFGSLLYTLKREKLTGLTLRRAEDFCKAALAWLKKAGHVKKVAALVEKISAHRAGILITLTLPNGSIKTFNWELLTDV